MRLPAQLLRNNPRAHKNVFGHAFIVAGSRTMLGAGALTSLAALRAGAGLVTIGTPKSLNSILQKKISAAVMTYALKETREQTISAGAYPQIEKKLHQCQCLAIGPGLSQNKSTCALARKIIQNIQKPVVIDADALNALAHHITLLTQTTAPKIITPHPGEMARLTGLTTAKIEQNRQSVAKKFARTYRCTVVLKGNRTVVASPMGRVYINTTGNPGMATAGSGDVLAGIIAGLLAQGLSEFNAATFGVYVHGKAGDCAAKKKSKISMIATDIIDEIPRVFRAAGG